MESFAHRTRAVRAHGDVREWYAAPAADIGPLVRQWPSRVPWSKVQWPRVASECSLSHMRARLGVPIILMAALFTPGRTTLAQDDGSWRLSLTPYAWLAGTKGRIGFAGGIADVDLTPGDVLDKVDLSVMLLLEARRDRLIGRLDINYVSLSDSKAVEDGTDDTVVLELDQAIIQPEIGYTALVAPWGGIDLLAGGRYWHPKANVSAKDPNGDVPISSGSRSWFDATGGLRVRYDPTQRLHLFTKGDVGAGGSKLTWQVMGGVGYDFADCCAVATAYKHLDDQYDRDALVKDSYLSGFALGLEIRF